MMIFINKKYFVFLILILFLHTNLLAKQKGKEGKIVEIKLLRAKTSSKSSFEKVLSTRRSRRSYKKESLTLKQISQLLWSAQGSTSPQGFRTAPSAGALYPLEIYLVAGDVKDLPAGVFKFDMKNKKLLKILDGDKRVELCNSCLGQSSVKNGSASIVICGIYERTTKKYGERAKIYVHVEVGCVSQNIYLQCESLGFGTVYVGAFEDKKLQKILNISKDEIPFCVMPIGVRYITP